MKKFIELTWYDQVIEFIFRFVAKTSEPLLAAGLVISAADYLSHGQVMAGHPAFSLAWAWAQALALESSSGVVFVYALQAFRQADKIKGAIYLALALLLAIVGGGMLLLQVNAVTMGSAETAVPILNVMRVVVSIAYIFLLRAKHIRFRDLADTREQPVIEQPAPVPAPIDLTAFLDQLDERYSRRMEAIVEQVVTRVQVSVTQEAPALPEHAESRPAAQSEQADSVSESRVEQVQALLEETPDASVRDIARAIGRSKSTAHKAIHAVKAKE